MVARTQPPTDESVDSASNRISVPGIGRRLSIGRLAVYSMLEQRIIPGVRLGRRWIITRHAYLTWECTCGMATGLQRQTEHNVAWRHACLQTQVPVGEGGLVLPIRNPGSTHENQSLVTESGFATKQEATAAEASRRTEEMVFQAATAGWPRPCRQLWQCSWRSS